MFICQCLQEEPNEVMAPAERSCWGTSLFMNVMVSFWRKGYQESLGCLIHLAITGQQLDVVIAKCCINGYYHMLDEIVRKRMAPSRICWMLLVFHRRQWLTGRVGAVGRPETEPLEKPAPLNTLTLQLHWSWTTERKFATVKQHMSKAAVRLRKCTMVTVSSAPAVQLLTEEEEEMIPEEIRAHSREPPTHSIWELSKKSSRFYDPTRQMYLKLDSTWQK